MGRFAFVFLHWKLGFHLVFATRHFGVNNRWWSLWPSPWGLPLWRQALSLFLIKPVLDRLWMMRVRMSHSHGWAPAPDYVKIFGSRRLYQND